MRFALPLLLILAACQAEAPDPVTELDSVPTEPAAATMEAETASGAKLNLNTATEDEFKALGVGDRMAHEFEEYRPYTSIREFRQEIGKYINDDPDQLAEYESMVFVPIDPNASDAETLQQIPGLDPGAADQLIAGRPYADAQAFLARYAELAPTADREAAAVYLGR